MISFASLFPSPDETYRPRGFGRRGVVADLLGFDVPLGDRVLGRSDHGFVAGWSFEGPELGVDDASRSAAAARRWASAFESLPPGTVVHWDVSRYRRPAPRPKHRGECPRGVAAALDAVAGVPEGLVQRTRVFVGLHPGTRDFLEPEAGLDAFESALVTFERLASDAGVLRRLEGEALFSAAAEACRFRRCRLDVPDGVYLDTAFATDRMEVVDRSLRIGDTCWAAVVVHGMAGALRTGFAENAVRRTGRPVRWVARLVLEDRKGSERRMEQRRWGHLMSRLDGLEVAGFFASFFSPGDPRKADRDDVEDRVAPLRDDCDRAIRDLFGGRVFGLATYLVWVGGSDAAQAVRGAREVRAELERVGFGAALESEDRIGAFRAGLPGNDTAFLRRLQIPVSTFAGSLPLGSPWVGEPRCGHPKKPQLGPLVICRTRYDELFAFDTFGGAVADVGSAAIVGPTGAGKSVWLNAMLLGALRYREAEVFSLDHGRSQTALAAALGSAAGRRALGEGAPLAPFADLQASAVDVAGTFVAELLHQQGLEPSPRLLNAVGDGLRRLSALSRPLRTLEQASALIQSREVREALEAFHGDGAYAGYLDGRPGPSDQVHRRFRLFEISRLTDLDPRVRIPTFVHLLGRMESALDGRTLRFFAVEEAHALFKSSRFVDGLDSALKRWRKRLGALWLVIHDVASLSDGPLGRAVRGSVPTLVLLPHPLADVDDDERAGYARLGLSDAEIDSLAEARPKHEYLVRKGRGRSVWVHLRLSELELALLGCAGAESDAVERFEAEHGERWIGPWARELGIDAREIEAFERVIQRGFPRPRKAA